MAKNNSGSKDKKKPLRYTWDINPVTRVKESKKKFNRDRQKEKDRNEMEKEDREYGD